MKRDKPKVIKDFYRLRASVQEQIKLAYPYGFSESLTSFTKPDGTLVSVLPFETDDKFYLLRMTRKDADKLVEADNDYDTEGNLKTEIRNEYEEKYVNLDEISEEDIVEEP